MPALLQWLVKTIKQINIRAAFHIYIIGIKKDNKVLVDILNDGIDKVIKNGEAAKISQKWFGKDIVLK